MSAGQNSELEKAAPTPAEIRFIDPLVDPAWDELVLSHPEATLFHSSAWGKVLARTYGHKPFYLHVIRRGITEALVPLMEVSSFFTGRRGVCLPFSDFCGPLLFGNADTTVVFEKLASLARERRWSHVQLRDQLPIASATAFYGHSLDLRPGAEALFARFSSPVRRAIRKAEKSGLTVERSESWASVRDFYQLHVETRRRHGLPPQPQSFFRNIFREVIEPGYGFVIRAFLKS
ncbi:MAG: peptidoglycan bridge formation glycyltransferase FemA/FemB family protein, partial [Chthoniobacterales bacterium]